jgi:xanthine permease XanP
MANKQVRAKDLVYGFDDKPPLGQMLLLSLQYLMAPTVSLVFPILVVQEAHAGVNVAASVISISLLIIAIISLWQALPMRRYGASMLFTPSNAPAYLAPSMLAAKIGGLPLMFTMTIFGGLTQMVFSFIIKATQRYFPVEIAGVVLALIGVELANIGLSQYHQSYLLGLHVHASFFYGFINVCPALLVIAFSLYGSRFLRLYAMAVGVVISYVALAFSGLMNPANLSIISKTAWFFLPTIPFTHFSFHAALLTPFIIAGLICSFKLVGCVAAIQKVHVEELYEVDMKQVSRANFIDGVASFLSGLFGSMGMNVSSSVVALTVSSKIASRYIAFPMAVVFFVAAFCPKLALLFVYMPKPIIAAILIPLGGALFVGSVRMILKNATTVRQHMIVGLAFVLGLSQSIYPAIYSQFPDAVKSFTGSSIAVAAIFALIVNALCLQWDRGHRV